MSIIENCGEVLMDMSLEKIINEFVRELAVFFFFM